MSIVFAIFDVWSGLHEEIHGNGFSWHAVAIKKAEQARDLHFSAFIVVHNYV